MSESKIEWTDRSDWNPVRGCTRVSPGCGGPGPHGGCYAEALAARFSKLGMWGHGFAEMKDGKPRWTGKVELQEDRVMLPLRWKKPARIFVSSTSDIFHEALPDEAIDKLFAVMALCPQHTFQVLTKRADRMLKYLSGGAGENRIWRAQFDVAPAPSYPAYDWPLPNVWLGVSCERQQEAEERIPYLLQTPASVRFISAEPLLGPINLADLHVPGGLCWNALGRTKGGETGCLDWVIAGGESGHNARPMNPQWARDIRDQCNAAGVAFFHKQNGEWLEWLDSEFSSEETESLELQNKYEYFQRSSGDLPVHMRRVGKKAAGRLLDGIEHNGMPRTSR